MSRKFLHTVSFKIIFLCLVITGIFTTPIAAQYGATPLSMANQRSGAYQVSDIDNIDYFTGRLNIKIPLANIQGRGGIGIPVTANLSYPTWRTTIDYTYTGYPDGNPGQNVTVENAGYQGLISTGFPGYTSRMSVGYSDTTTCYGSIYRTGTVTRIYVTDVAGVEHELRDVQTDGRPLSMQGCSYASTYRGRVFVSKDGSDIMFTANQDVYDTDSNIDGYAVFKDGTTLKVVIENDSVITTLTDRNGNITKTGAGVNYGANVTKITDSTGRSTSVQSIFWADQNIPGYVKYKGFNGQDRQSTVTSAMLHDILVPGETIKTYDQLFGTHPGTYDSDFDALFMSVVTLPNGQSYHFKYNSYGEVSRVELPTGGAIEYTWAGGANGMTSGFSSGGYGNYVYRRVIERREYDDGINLTRTTTISRPETLNGSTIQNQGYVDVKTYTPQLETFERHYYYGQASQNLEFGGGYTDWRQGKEYKTEILSPQNSSLLRATEQKWQQTPPSWWNCSTCTNDNSPVNNPHIVETKTTLCDSNQVSKQTFVYDDFNNLKDTYDYDYGIGAPGTFMRRSHTYYLTTDSVSGINYTSDSIHILNLPSYTWVSSDAAGTNKVSYTKFEYDNYSNAANDLNHDPLFDRTSITGHDAAFGTEYKSRGNVTAITGFANANNQTTGGVTSYRKYDIAGNPIEARDAKGYASYLDFSDRFGLPDAEAQSNTAPTQLSGQQTYAFATRSTNSAGYTTFEQFDYFTGAVVDAEDINGNVSSTFYGSDPLDRPTQMIAANNRPLFRRQTTIAYDDDAREVMMTSDSKEFNDKLLKVKSLYDKMGRTKETRQYETATGYVAVQQEYDALGRAYKSSNPFRPNSGESPQWTTSKFDSLGRVIEVKTPDNAVVTRSYSGTTTTVTDQALRKRSGTTDAIGRLLKVNEDPTGVNYETTYLYDVLGRLRKTTQVEGTITQNRYFMYNDLGRLIRAKQPEQIANTSLPAMTDPISGNSAWSVAYNYDANGNISSTTDANNRTVTGTYDNLNRLTLRDYSDTATPDVTFTFDDSNANSKGQLTAVTTTDSSTQYTAFDELGRVKSSRQTTNGQTYNMPDYSYDLSGALVAQTYPSLRVVTTETDNLGRLSKVLSQMPNQSSKTYLSNLSYTSFGAVSSARLGNGSWESAQFDSKRLQVKQIGLGASFNDTSYLKLEYDYGTTGNNGSLQQQKITVQGATTPITQNYGYDALNRLQSATETVSGSANPAWKQTFTYDRFGNRRFDTSVGATTTLPQNNGIYNPNIDQANNRFTVAEGYNYDNEGNLLSNPESQSFTYDAENHQRQVQGANGTANYYYDGSGKRVRKVVGTEETIFVYDAFGKMVAEYTVNQTVTNEGTKYLTTDALGSPRAITDNSGHIKSRHDYMPFGEEVYGGVGGRTAAQGYQINGDGVRQQFTGYERDAESGLDYAQARYFSSKHGRFTSVDPLMASASTKNPQTFNRYSYGLNSPYKFTDSLGLSARCQGPGGGQGSTLQSCDGEDTDDNLDNNNIRKVTTTTTHEVTVVERGGGQIVREAKILIAEKQTQLINEDGNVIETEPTQTTATASNTGNGVRDFSQDQLNTMANLGKNIVEVSREKQFDPTIALGIARTETHMGMLQSKESSPAKQSDVNPMQLSGSSGIKPTTDLRSNIAGAIDVYNRGSTSNLNTSLQVYNSQADKVRYAATAEGHINAIRSAVTQRTDTVNNWEMRNYRPARVGSRPR